MCLNRCLKSPYKPQVGGPDDTSNFDEYPDSPAGLRKLPDAEGQAKFDDF
jgi:hypothetical protein